MRLSTWGLCLCLLLGVGVNAVLAQCSCSPWKDPYAGRPEAERTTVWVQILKDTSLSLKAWEDALAAGKGREEVLNAAETTQSSWRSALDCFAYRPPQGYALDDLWLDGMVNTVLAFGEAYRGVREGDPAAQVLKHLQEARLWLALTRQGNKQGTMGDAATAIQVLLKRVEQAASASKLKEYGKPLAEQVGLLQTAPTPPQADADGYTATKGAALQALEPLLNAVQAGDVARAKGALSATRDKVELLYTRYGRDLI